MIKSEFIGDWEGTDFDINLNENSLDIIWKKKSFEGISSADWYIENGNLVLSYHGGMKRIFSVIMF